MIVRDIADYPHETVIDRSLLCELLHPDKVAGAEKLECSIAQPLSCPVSPRSPTS